MKTARKITLTLHFSIPSFFYLLVVLVVLGYLFISPDSVGAAIPNSARIIPYQGVLTNSSGNYVADGNYSMVFAIYSVASAGTALWSETQTVTVTNGVFSVNIGSTDANGVNLAMDTPPYYLGVKVGTNAEMTPRILLAFSPFSFVAKNVDVVPPGVPTGGVMFFNLSACPSGWTELTAARGRTIVGLPLSGTLAGTVGTAFTNLEDRTHTHTGPSHAHDTPIGLAGDKIFYYSPLAPAFSTGQTYDWNRQASTTNPGLFSAGVVTTAASGTGATSATSATMPYIQLLACQKS